MGRHPLEVHRTDMEGGSERESDRHLEMEFGSRTQKDEKREMRLVLIIPGLGSLLCCIFVDLSFYIVTVWP